MVLVVGLVEVKLVRGQGVMTPWGLNLDMIYLEGNSTIGPTRHRSCDSVIEGVGDVSMGASRRANRTPDPSKCQPMAMLATLDFIGVRLLATRM